MSESDNARGEIFEDFITSNGLFACNTDKKFTYDCALGQSIIDITITSSLLADRVNDWTVRNENYFSDHKLISSNLNFNKAQTYKSRNYKKANWSFFRKQLTMVKWKSPILWSTHTIEILKMNGGAYPQIQILTKKLSPKSTMNTKL